MPRESGLYAQFCFKKTSIRICLTDCTYCVCSFNILNYYYVQGKTENIMFYIFRDGQNRIRLLCVNSLA